MNRVPLYILEEAIAVAKRQPNIDLTTGVSIFFEPYEDLTRVIIDFRNVAINRTFRVYILLPDE